MSGRPTVSVIVPAYNQAVYLRATIESILNQSYPDIELIVVDDGSVDATPSIAAEYASRLTYLRQTNRGVGAARNAGLHVSRGEFLTFMDHDDLMLPQKIARQVDALDHAASVSVVHCGYYLMDAEGRFVEKAWFRPSGDVLSSLLFGNFVWVGGPLMRRQCVEQVGDFSEDVPWTSDWDYWLRAALHGYHFACVQEPLGAYRVVAGSMMSHPGRLERDVLTVMDRAFSDCRLPDHLVATRRDAVAAMRLWIGLRYLRAGHDDEGLRNLHEAFNASPGLRSLAGLSAGVSELALAPDTVDPVGFAGNVVAHWAAFEIPGDDGQRVLRDLHFALAIRAFLADDGASGAHHLSLASLPSAPVTCYEKFLVHAFMHVPVDDPRPLVESTLAALERHDPRFKRLRRPVSAAVLSGLAFQRYHARDRTGAIAATASAIARRPSVLWNRGVLSLAVKALGDRLPTHG